MAGRNRNGPRCSNSWRPSDGPLSSQAPPFWREQLPVPLDGPRRRSKSRASHSSSQQYSDLSHRLTTNSAHGPLEQPVQMFKNPNLIPVVPRRDHTAQLLPPRGYFYQSDETEEERLPQIWHPSIDDLIRRTSHDFDLVMNYEQDAEGGKRWLPGDIARIRAVGKSLHRNIFALKRWQRVVAQQGDRDKGMLMHVKSEANLVKLQCERVQRAIVKYEQKCEVELLRDGAYAQDEDGNFYKPITSQGFLHENICLHDVLHSSTEGTANDNWAYAQHHDQATYGDYKSSIVLETPPETEPSSPPKRNLAFDSGFQSTPFDRLQRKAKDQFSVSHSDRVTSGRVAKSFRVSSRRCDHHLPPPVHRDQSSGSTHSIPSTEGIKPRSRGRSSYYERDGLSRRQAKKNDLQYRSPSPFLGHLGMHKLHY